MWRQRAEGKRKRIEEDSVALTDNGLNYCRQPERRRTVEGWETGGHVRLARERAVQGQRDEYHKRLVPAAAATMKDGGPRQVLCKILSLESAS